MSIPHTSARSKQMKSKGERLTNPVAKDYYDLIWDSIDARYDDLHDMINLTTALSMMIIAIQESMNEYLQDNNQCPECEEEI